MDYDDNDFQSQNLHIPGEGSTKFPPVLRPYALSKFDFDESLQGHLRFDSLVETGVFLGIESNEDNQWIDVYSRGNNGIEFSSTAAESSSISRHNNVWSEATSLESVEMLLKSVGQEEFIPRETVILESDGCDELACLAKQMEPNPKPDNRNEFKDNVTDLQPPRFILENLAGLKEEEREQPLAGVYQGELFIDRNLSYLQPHCMLGNIDLPVARGILITDDKSNDANQGKVETVADGSLEEKTQLDSAASGVKTSFIATSQQNFSSTCDALNIQNVQNLVVGVGDEEQNSFQIQTNEQDLDSSVISKDSDVDTQTSDVNAVSGEAHHSDCISDLQNTESCNEDASFTDLSRGIAEEDAIVDNQSALNTSDSPTVTIRGDSSSEGHIIGASKSECSTCPNFQQDVGTVEKTYGESSFSKEKKLLNISNLETEVLLSKSEASIFAVGDNNTPTVNKRNTDSKEGSFSSLGAVASSKSCILGEATQGSEKNEPDKQGDCENLCQDVSVIGQENKKATFDSSLMQTDVDQSYLVETGVSSSSLNACNIETKLTTSAVSIDAKPVNNSASQYILEKMSLTSCEKMEVSPPSRVVSIHGVTDPYEIQGVTRVGSDGKENAEGKIANEASSEGKVANEASSEATIANEASSEAKIANEACSEAKIAYEASVEAEIANEASTQTKIANDASSEAKIVNEASSEGKIANEASSEGKIANEASSEGKIANEASTSLLVGSPEHETVHCPGTETKKQDILYTSRQLLCKPSSSCVTTVSEKMEKPQETPSDEVDQVCPKEVSIAAVLCVSIEKHGDKVEVSFTKDEKEAMQENHNKLSAKISGDDLFTNEGSKSSLPDSCTKLHETGSSPVNCTDNTCVATVTFGSQPEMEKKVNQIKDSANLNPSVSECRHNDALKTVTDHDLKGNDASKVERNLVPKVNPVATLSKKDISEKIKGTNSSKRQRAAANKASMVVEESLLAPTLGTPKTKVAGSISLGSPQISDGIIAHSVFRGTPERKTRPASNKTSGKETSRKVNKGKTPGRQSERGDRTSCVSLSPLPGFQVMQSNEVQQYGHIDSITTKSVAISNASTSSLPDLNSSASPPVLSQQPFMDTQQIQLRAQILVYGALIQGTVPDEACMISAFGSSDGGRNIWQNAWSSCIERQHGPRTTDVAVKQNVLQGKDISSPLGLASSKASPTITNPLMPLSSPLWSLPTPSCDTLQSDTLARGSVVDYSQALSSLYSYLSPPLRNFIGHNTSWLSQTPLRGAWTPTPAPVTNSPHLPASPLIDTIQFSSVQGSSVPPSSIIKNVPPGLPASSAGIQTVFVATSPPHDTNNVTELNAQHSSDSKPKKRKKVMVSEDLGQKAMHLQSQLVPTPVVSSHISTAVASSTLVGSMPMTTVKKSVVSVTPLSLADHLKSDWNVEKRILSDESLTKIREARVNAKEASALSAAAVNHSLEIWKQLDKQKNSGLVSDIEAKLASAAVAVAAAAAVTKAAAAAASVASNAALHAKLMADEALISSGHEGSCQIFRSEGMSNLGKATPASILKGNVGISSCSSIIGAAKEAARRRVEDASAASKRAENMDAIVEAAELAAETVSQVGKIVTMGDPLALNELVETGLEGCWNTSQESCQQVGLLKDMTSGLVNADNVGDRPETCHIHNGDISSYEMGKKTATSEKLPFHTVDIEIFQDHMKCIDGVSPSIIDQKSSEGQKGRKVSDLVNHIDMFPESETEIQATSIAANGIENLEENIKEGSFAEVFKDERLKAAWHAATVLSLKDGKAYVYYTSLVDEGGEPLKEWISLEGEENKAPRIRACRNFSGLHNEGTRKRQREAMVDYIWSVGDRVDVWSDDSWQEGVITDQNKKDRTLTVHIPVTGKTKVARACHLRPSLVWKDGKWIEFSKVGANDSFTHEGDAPHEKRPRLGSPVVEVKGKNRTLKVMHAVESANAGELMLIDLTQNDIVFNIGKNSKNENKSDAPRMVRTGLQKEGSRVIFGVPKPGKKRKFMEVSKHYVADETSKINENDSVKLSNFLIPQGTGSRGWKNSPKNYTKKQLGSDSRPAFKSGKPENVLCRVNPPNENPLSSSRTNIELTCRPERIKDSSCHFKNVSQSENQLERASYSGNTGAGVGPIMDSSLAPATDSHPAKKTSTSRASKGKLAPTGGSRLGKIDEEKTSDGNPMRLTSEITEPRRSNRRIQPTSRLLEGLQSSLIISKIPSSQEKGQKNQNRNTSTGNQG